MNKYSVLKFQKSSVVSKAQNSLTYTASKRIVGTVAAVSRTVDNETFVEKSTH